MLLPKYDILIMGFKVISFISHLSNANELEKQQSYKNTEVFNTTK